jgi:hypothetical protein
VGKQRERPRQRLLIVIVEDTPYRLAGRGRLYNPRLLIGSVQLLWLNCPLLSHLFAAKRQGPTIFDDSFERGTTGKFFPQKIPKKEMLNSACTKGVRGKIRSKQIMGDDLNLC